MSTVTELQPSFGTSIRFGRPAAALILALSLATLATSGCDDSTTDEQTRKLVPIPPTGASATQAADDVIRRSLRIIPFTAEFSRAWQITSASTGTTVVEARPDGAEMFEIFILSKERSNTQLMNLLIADAKSAATRPASAATTQAAMPYTNETQRVLAVAGAQGVEYTQTDSQGLVTVRARLFVPTNAADPAADVQVYELSIPSLKPDQHKAHAALIRKIIDSLEYDAGALRTGN